MKAFVVDRHGGNDHVRLAEMPEPALRDDDVLVRIHAAAAAGGLRVEYAMLGMKLRNGEVMRAADEAAAAR